MFDWHVGDDGRGGGGEMGVEESAISNIMSLKIFLAQIWEKTISFHVHSD